jgi:TetR/AcrR family transcriptional regulator, transcriptional repressor of aconitase
MPKIVDSAAKRRAILAAAAVTFARDGYRRTNLQRVAARAGMGKSSLYHYFPTKEALFSALADDFLRQEADVFAATASLAEPAAARLWRLVDAVDALLDAWTRVGPLLVDFLREPRGRRRVRETFRAARTALARLIRDGQRDGVFRPGAPQALATVVLAGMDGLFLQELVEPGSARGVAVGDLLREQVSALLGCVRP